MALSSKKRAAEAAAIDAAIAEVSAAPAPAGAAVVVSDSQHKALAGTAVALALVVVGYYWAKFAPRELGDRVALGAVGVAVCYLLTDFFVREATHALKAAAAPPAGSSRGGSAKHAAGLAAVLPAASLANADAAVHFTAAAGSAAFMVAFATAAAYVLPNLLTEAPWAAAWVEPHPAAAAAVSGGLTALLLALYGRRIL